MLAPTRKAKDKLATFIAEQSRHRNNMATQRASESCPCASIDEARAKESLQASKLRLCIISGTMRPFPL